MSNPNKDMNVFRAEDGTVFVKVPLNTAAQTASWMRRFDGVEMTEQEVYDLEAFENFVGDDLDFLFSEFSAGFENMEPIAVLLGLKSEDEY